LPLEIQKMHFSKKIMQTPEDGLSHRLLPVIVVVVVALLGGLVYDSISKAATVANADIFTSGIGSSKCMDDAYDSKANYTKVQLYGCNKGTAQQWIVNTNGTIENANGACLDLSGAQFSNNSKLVMYTCNANAAEQWKLSSSTIVNPKSGKCIDDPYSSAMNGTQLILYTCKGTTNQKWVVSVADSQQGATSDPSGETMPVGNIPDFRQIYATNFNSFGSVPVGAFSGCDAATPCSGLTKYSALKNVISDYPDGWGDTEYDNDTSSPGACYYYPSETLSVASGVLNMFIHTDSSNRCVTSVPEPLLPTADQSPAGENSQLYGEYSVRMRSDSVPGYLVAFLLWPADQKWPQDGEIDFPNSELTGTVTAFMHHEGGTSGGDQDIYSSKITYSGWHTYTTIWTPSSVKFEIDGTVIGTSTVVSEIPDTPMYWVFQTEGDISTSKPSASAEGNLQIAWATVYAYDPSEE
jgi:hypothetical protein